MSVNVHGFGTCNKKCEQLLRGDSDGSNRGVELAWRGGISNSRPELGSARE